MTHFLRRTAMILAGASSLAACSTYQPFEGEGPGTGPTVRRPNYPVQLPVPPAATPSAPAAPPESSQARPTQPIEGRSLPPASSNQPGYVTPSTPAGPSTPPPSAYSPPVTTPYQPLPPPPPAETAPPPQAYEPPPEPAPPPKPRTQTVTKTTVTGKVVDVEGPRVSYTVEKKDNLNSIGRKLDTDPETLAKDNKLKAPYVLHPGQELKGPVTHRKAYVVVGGDTLFSIAKRFSVTAKALGEENGLKTGASLKPGQKIRLPEDYKDKGPIKTTTKVTLPPEPAPPPRPAPRPAYTPPAPSYTPPAPAYTPPAPAYNPPPSVYAPPAPPARPAYTPPPAPPAPTYTAPRPAPPPPPATAPYRPLPSSPPPATTPYRPLPPPPAPTTKPYTPSTPAPSTAAPIVPSTPTLTDQQISDLGRGRFIWPVRGEILSPFGPKPTTGQRNDGINIRAMAGEPVKAAAAGDIVYAGDQVPGFGNLVLVKHSDGWVTAYGHLARSDVKMQQKVVQGQQLGIVGATGGVTETQLHFEVRYAPTPADRARPIDPNLVLPK